MSDPKYTLVEYVAADCFAVSNAAKDSFVSEFVVGLRLRADCQADGLRLGSVTGAIHDAGTGRTLVNVLLDSGAVLTANLTWVLHGCVAPNALCSHTHEGPGQGGALPAFVKADCSVPFVGGHIRAEGGYTGFMFTETGTDVAANAAKSLWQVDGGQISLLCLNDAETEYNTVVTVDRNGATPTYYTVTPPALFSSGITTRTINDQDISSGVITKAMGMSGGECHLTLSATNLLLSRYNGKRLIIDDTMQTIPPAGVTLAATGTTALALYYIYAFMSSGTMTLEASTTAYTADSRNGVMVKTEDATRTLVGMARTNASGAWVDSVTQRFVLSHYNQQTKPIKSTAATDISTASTSAVVLSTIFRTEFLSWGEQLTCMSHLRTMTSVPSSACFTAFYLNGSSAFLVYSPSLAAYSTVNDTVFFNLSPTIGYNYIDVYGYVNTGTGIWSGWANYYAFDMRG